MKAIPIYRLFWLGAALLPCVAVAQVHRCDVGGRVVMQDRPCDGVGAERVRPPLVVVPRPVNAPPIGDPMYEQEKEAQRRKELEEFGRQAGKRAVEDRAVLRAKDEALRARCGDRGESEPYIGATAKWVRDCSTWGDPSGVNTTSTANGVTQQWVYRHRGYLYFDNQERLVAIQK